MRNFFIRLLIIVAMLLGAGNVLAWDLINKLSDSQNAINVSDRRILGNTTVNFVNGPFPDNATYYVYNSPGPLTISASLNNKPYNAYRSPWGWIITDVASDQCSGTHILWSTYEATLNEHIFDVCDSPITWLQTVALTPNQMAEDYAKPGYSVTDSISLRIGPEGTRIQPNQELDNVSVNHRDLTWQTGHVYNLRYFNKLVTSNRYSFIAERKIVYMGATEDYVKDLSDTKVTAHKNESFIINIHSDTPKRKNENHYNSEELDYLQSCNSFVTDISSSIRDEDKSNGGKSWALAGGSLPGNVPYVDYYARIDLSDTVFKAEHAYSVDTACTYAPYGNFHVLYAGYLRDGKSELTFNHKFAILPEPKTDNTSTVILSLTGHFLADNRIYVQGKFDDSAPDQPNFKYAVKDSASQTANWLTPENVKWNPGNTNPANCPKCFSFVIPASNVPAKDKISLVQVLPDEHSSEQAAHPDVAAFTLQELANVGFANAQGETWACGTENEVTATKDNNGVSLIKVKLTVKHAVDNITGNIWLPSLPVTYKGNGTVSYAAAGQSAVATSDIGINENDKGKTAVNWAASTADKVLKPGVYVITLPVDVPAYRQEDVGPESLTLYANVYGAKSILLKQRDSSPDPAYVQCQDMFNGAVP